MNLTYSRLISNVLLAIVLGLTCLSLPQTAQAAGVSTVCNEARLDAALLIGGTITFTKGCGSTLILDQRGAARPTNGKCDIGSVESGSSLPWAYLPLVRK